jgi:hypothetical protein
MRPPFLVAGIFLANLSPVALAADEHDLWHCRVMADAVARLRCYDSLVPRPTGRATPPDQDTAYREMPIGEVKADITSLKGKLVEVSGLLTHLSDRAVLGAGPMDTTPLPLEIRRLPRAQRLAISSRCDVGCLATIHGRVNDVFFGVGVIAESVTFR